MILEQNVPASVRTWAVCQVKIRRNERAIRLLEAGEPVDFRTFALIGRWAGPVTARNGAGRRSRG